MMRHLKNILNHLIQKPGQSSSQKGTQQKGSSANDAVFHQEQVSDGFHFHAHQLIGGELLPALAQVVYQAIADNKSLLLQSGVRLEVEEMADTVYSDEKWVRFILNQLIANAVKYRSEQSVLHFSTLRQQDLVVLMVEDNGIGIPSSDLPRIFEKGFTGQNGRIIQQSTGIGLYLCKRLCEKLGIGITADSSEHGTAISLSFHINCLIQEVQN